MTLRNIDLDQTTLRDAYSRFPSGVVAIAAEIDGRPVGMAASSFVPVSIDPPLVAVCLQKKSTTWPRLEVVPSIAVSVLAESHDIAARRLAAKTGDRFAGLDLMVTAGGGVFVGGSVVWLETTFEQKISAGDHLIVLLRIRSLEVMSDLEPIVFHGSKFRRLRF
ncbi:flavin reductase [Rhodococcus sp. SBT000017]|uniref:flavin reductase family protein n=1 Tax=unclassified Rhodococcus (in: high G+C Gram-positive bacteria) TaxID=192944 RepID=UPI000EF87530|nr:MULTISPECIES: flavin reductase family protein [unclassified Rhodococcus (in: high G+C Gram-positive bacteria)]RMB75288.1 flavin reductase [Rhodococcus sp. SBT000017]